ncbi:MAG: DNA gyrase inhibitor YacG, partial [Methylobacterium sp.]|nr:DNA gyrase inhibitor YacG [Methylobacterium sp.]
KPVLEAFRPFCSKRCADVDLNRWLGGQYALPAEDEPLPSHETGGDER